MDALLKINQPSGEVITIIQLKSVIIIIYTSLCLENTIPLESLQRLQKVKHFSLDWCFVNCSTTYGTLMVSCYQWQGMLST